MNDAAGVILSHGAIRAAPVGIEAVMAYAAGRMKARLAAMPFVPTCAVVAVFAGRPRIESVKGGDYSRNDACLRAACEELRKRYPSNSFHPSADAYPLPAVQAARLAGLGVVGVNGLLRVPVYGTAVTVGAVLTDLPDAAPPGIEDGYCERCGACVKACPSGALTYSGGIRAYAREKCLSYLRQKKGAPLERPGYYGCDICQEACPYNAASGS